MRDILPEPRSRRPVPLGRWILATALGWVVGIPVMMLMFAGAEAVGLSEGQFAIGLGMGATVGFLQWRQARRSFGATSAWFWASAVGMTLPFALCDLVGYGLDGMALIAPTALGALLVGLGQHRLFGIRGLRTYCWVPASVIAWALAAATNLAILPIPDHPTSGLLQWLRPLLAFGSGGIVLGLITGLALVWLFRSPPDSPLVPGAAERQDHQRDVV
jgi:hypothetical protein